MKREPGLAERLGRSVYGDEAGKVVRRARRLATATAVAQIVILAALAVCAVLGTIALGRWVL